MPCDRHLMHGGESVEAPHEVRVGNNLWKLCDECKDSLHNWFGTFPNEHDERDSWKEELNEYRRIPR